MSPNVWNRERRKQARFLVSTIFCAAACVPSTAVSLRSAEQTKASRGQPTTVEKSSPSLARQVRHQLAELPFYSEFDYITFTLDGKKVTLSGQVLRPSLKKHAVSAIQSLEEVESVVDQIEVLPPSPDDNELRRAVYRAIYEDPTLAAYAVQGVPPIHIIVKNGNVALEGAVKSATDKNLAAARAGSAPNAGPVKNNLKVVPPSQSAAE